MTLAKATRQTLEKILEPRKAGSNKARTAQNQNQTGKLNQRWKGEKPLNLLLSSNKDETGPQRLKGEGGQLPPPTPILAGQLTLFQSGDKSMSTPLLLAPPDFLTFLRPWQRWKGKPDSCSLASRHDFEYSSVTSHDDIAIHSLQEVYLQGNTTYLVWPQL